MKKILLFFISALLSASFVSAQGRRVLYIGDSITDGAWGNSGKWNATSDERDQSDMNHIYGHGYMMLCASYYQSEYPQDNLVFWNRGISGNTLCDLEGRWQHDVIELKPDVVSILIGTNDVDRTFWDNANGIDYAAWELEYRHLLDTTRAVLPDVRFVLCTPFVAEVGRLKGTVTYKAREEAIGQLCRCIERIAADYNAVLVDFNAMFEGLMQSVSPDNDTYWIWDGIHPTPAGHYKMYKLWKEKAGALIKRSFL